MPPKAKARKPKKPVLQKQKQSQRVVVNINQEKAKRRRAPKPRQRQTQLPSQVSFQPIISMSGSVPVPPPYYNPSPIQSAGGFIPPPPAPTSLGAPLEVPVFAGESAKVIGDERVSVPVSKPVSVPESIIVPIEPVVPDDRPIIMPRPVPAPPTAIISTITASKKGDNSIASQSLGSRAQSLSSLFSDISKETGITSSDVAKFMFKKKPKTSPPPLWPVGLLILSCYLSWEEFH